MKGESKIPKRVIYKRAHFTTPGLILQDLLKAALLRLTEPADKTWSPSQDSELRRLLNDSSRRSGCLCFQFLQYESGKDQTLVTLKSEAGAFPIDQEPVPPRNDGTKREILESALYCAVYENHMAICQSAALRTDSLEKYLLWLLFDRTCLIPEDTALALADEPTAQAKAKIERKPIKAVRFGDDLAMNPRKVGPHRSGEPQNTVLSTEVMRTSSLAADMLTRLLGEDKLRSWRQAGHDLDPRNIRVKVEVSYLRKTNDSGQSLLHALAQVNRNSEDSSCEIELEGGSTIHGNELRVQGEIRVEGRNGIPYQIDMFRNLAQWLKDQVVGSKV